MTPLMIQRKSRTTAFRISVSKYLFIPGKVYFLGLFRNFALGHDFRLHEFKIFHLKITFAPMMRTPAIIRVARATPVSLSSGTSQRSPTSPHLRRSEGAFLISRHLTSLRMNSTEKPPKQYRTLCEKSSQSIDTNIEDRCRSRRLKRLVKFVSCCE